MEALAEPGDGDDAFDEIMHADLARRGLTLETWAAQLQEKANAVLAQNRRARRMRVLKIAAACVAGLAVAVGVALALGGALRGMKGDPEAALSMKVLPALPALRLPDAGAAAAPPR